MDNQNRPVIGVTMDIVEEKGVLRQESAMAYSAAVERAGGVSLCLPAIVSCVRAQLACVDGIVFTGGDDLRTEGYGEPTDPRAVPVHEVRQKYEQALMAAVTEAGRRTPALGVCMGMQMMALHAGGKLDQYMPATCDPNERHWEREHAIVPVMRASIDEGVVSSKHHQCVTDPGGLTVAALSDDGVIEMLVDPERPFHVGVQWHPERTTDDRLGVGLFARLVEAARRHSIRERESLTPKVA